MNQKKQNLELTWVGKHKRPRLEPRILLEDTEKSYHAEPKRRPGKTCLHAGLRQLRVLRPKYSRSEEWLRVAARIKAQTGHKNKLDQIRRGC